MIGRSEYVRRRNRLDATFKRIPDASSDLELQSDYAKYLCVLVSGFFEKTIVALVLDYVSRNASPAILLHVEKELDRWTNPNVEKIFQLLASFSQQWRNYAELYLVDERRASVLSLVALRHQIAHGESVGTSLSQVKAHYKHVVDVLDFLADLLDPK